MPVEYLKESPSQTAGPYVHIGTLPAFAGLSVRTQEKLNILPGSAGGTRIRIEGVVLDGAGAPVRDAMLEIWQANHKGEYNAKDFTGWGRVGAAWEDGEWFFETIKPGTTAWHDGRPQAPHINVLIFARGINIHLHTRLYFSDEADANAKDPVLKAVDPVLVPTLVANHQGTKDGLAVYRFNIVLQGPNETVFFDF